MKSLRLYATIVVVVLLFIPAWATTVIRMDLQTLVQESDSIVQTIRSKGISGLRC